MVPKLTYSVAWKYFCTVMRHKWFVFQECQKFAMYWTGLTHDLSKLYPSEFKAYALFFEVDKKHKEGFLKAWELHQKRNSHHWEFWVYIDVYKEQRAKEMSMPAIFEMVCDWIGAGKAYTGKDNLETWYLQNKDSMLLHPITRIQVEALLEKLGYNIRGGESDE